jgi:nucleoid-associated protein YgaU
VVNKISAPLGPPETAAVESAAGAEVDKAQAVDAPARTAESAAVDAVTRIAEDVAKGRISREEAVERIIDETLGSDLVQAAPADMRAEIAAALESLVATDPYLQSLVRGIASAPSGDGA